MGSVIGCDILGVVEREGCYKIRFRVVVIVGGRWGEWEDLGSGERERGRFFLIKEILVNDGVLIKKERWFMCVCVCGGV